MIDDAYSLLPERVLRRCRAEAFATLTPTAAATTHLSIVPRLLKRGHRLSLVDQTIVVPDDSVLVFVDQMPDANYGHPCQYRFHSPSDGSLLHSVSAEFPPEVAAPGLRPELFHAPLRRMASGRPLLQALIEPRVWPWLREDGNRFAVLFTSRISNRRHVEDLELGWRVLRNQLGFPASNIYVLCYDGTIGAVDATSSELAKWVGDDTPYQMHIHDSATTDHLRATMETIGSRMDADSLLFVHTNNHGSTNGLCIDNSTVLTPSDWGTMLTTLPEFGRLVVTMEQCYSGAFLQPTLDNSTAAATCFASAVPADKVSAGDTHFDPWARTWFEALNSATAYGGDLPADPDGNRDGLISVREAFDYSDAHDTAAYDDPQYGDSPAGCGRFVYLTRRPTLADIIAEITDRLVAIDTHIHKGPPLPDPDPGWAAKLIPSLELLDTLSHRLQMARGDQHSESAGAAAR
ncbi:C13 family peptidase [Nocardia sp. CA-129566]|uniref:C13 family peptidase n=1 Tax=Nocardia sp. CA-129566 TaxID=3239976 RepID=UPI003D96D096